MDIRYKIIKDYGCHPDEPCWVVTASDLPIELAIQLHRDEQILDAEIIVMNPELFYGVN